MTRVLRLATMLFFVLPLMTLAADEKSDVPRQPGFRGDPRFQPDGGAPREGYRFRRFAPFDEQEWKQAEQWMEDHAPKRWEFYQRIPAGARKDGFQRAIVRRIRNLDRLKTQSVAVYELRLQHIQLEDDAFGLYQDLKSATKGPERDKLESALKVKIGLLFDNAMAERHQRIEELQKFLARQREAVEKDSHQRQQLVDADYDRFVETGILEFRNKEPSPEELVPPEDAASRPASAPGADD